MAVTTFGTNFSLNFPFILNMPGFYNAYPTVHIKDLEWYYYDFAPSATSETKQFVGINSGDKNG